VGGGKKRRKRIGTGRAVFPSAGAAGGFLFFFSFFFFRVGVSFDNHRQHKNTKDKKIGHKLKKKKKKKKTHTRCVVSNS
jgi:hypothetical protein